MLKKCFILVLSVVLFACSGPSQLTAVPLEKISLEPTATPTLVPAPTSIEMPTAVAPEPAVDPNLFHDDFTGTLDKDWSWVREDPHKWSLDIVPGSLQIGVGSGYVVAGSISNLLLRSAPEGDFLIETQVIFRPTRNFQFAGLIIYESDLNFIQAGRAYCQGADCVGEGLYMDYYRQGIAVKPHYGQAYAGIDPILLRLIRRGETFTFEGSTNGKVWFVIGSCTSDMKALQIGLVAGQKITGNSRPALFDYFEVRSVP